MTRTARLTAGAVACILLAGGCSSAGTALTGVRTPTSAPTDAGAVDAGQARAIAARVLTAAALAQHSTAATAQTALQEAFTGQALRAAAGDARFAAVAAQVAAPPPAFAPSRPGVLAVSRGTGYPRAIVAETLPAAKGLPVLHLLTSGSTESPYRISASATLLPDAAVRRFDPLASGSLLVGDGARLSVRPLALLSDYARGLAYPPPKVRPATYTPGDRFATQLTTNAAEQAKATAVQARFTQHFRVLAPSTYAVQQAGGSALVFGVLERTDTFAVTKGQTINAPAALKAVQPQAGRLSKGATLTTLEFLVFTVPASGAGKATLVAATEHLVDASGR